VFPGAFSSFGNQVFVEADSNYLVHSFFDSSPRLMTVSQQGYETGATNVSGGLLTGDIITTMDGQLASADNLSTASPSDSNDVRISKFDRAGNTIWQYIYGSAQQNQRVSAIVQGTTGHYAFAGGIGNPSTTTGYVACIDEAGNELWHTGLFGSFEIFDYQLAATPDGGYFVAGSRNAFNNSFYMAKLDQNGNVEWNSQDYQGLYVRAVATTTDGNIAFIGEGNDFTWLVKIAPDGTELWLQEWPARYVTGLVQTNDGGFAYLYEKYESNGISKIGLVRTDSNGNELWEQEFYSFPGRSGRNRV
jgi:DNA-binding beta-propeller fold protein YncE